MKERPIIFNDQMVRALLGGMKTQTRRVVKDPSTVKVKWVKDVETFPNGKPYTGWIKECGAPLDIPIKCPHGVPGDRLWVREVFTLESSQEVQYDPPHKDGRPLLEVDGGFEHGTWWEQAHYRATDPEPELVVEGMDGPGCRWSAPFYLPRWASRILLEIKEVRVERVQDVSAKDAQAEGIPIHVAEHTFQKCYREQEERDAKRIGYFKKLWDSINAKKPGREWKENPWVWVITFEVVK